MPDRVPGPAAESAPGPAADRARRMRAIAAELAAAGLTSEVHDTRSVLDVTATLAEPGRKEIDVIVDDDLYTEIRYWNPPGATPAQVTATIARALTAITRS